MINGEKANMIRYEMEVGRLSGRLISGNNILQNSNIGKKPVIRTFSENNEKKLVKKI